MSATESLILNEISQSLKKMVGDVKLIDNDELTMQIIPFSLGDWHTEEKGDVIIRHSIGDMPDSVVIIASNLGFHGGDYYDDYFINHRLISKVSRTFYKFNDEYGEPYIEYYDLYAPRETYCEYSSEIPKDTGATDLLKWDSEKITIRPYDNVVFMPRQDETYGQLGEYYAIVIRRKAVV